MAHHPFSRREMPRLGALVSAVPLNSDWARVNVGTREELETFTGALRRTLRT